MLRGIHSFTHTCTHASTHTHRACSNETSFERILQTLSTLTRITFSHAHPTINVLKKEKETRVKVEVGKNRRNRSMSVKWHFAAFD